MRDDGAIIYVSGVEVVRSNMPAGTVSYTTRATTAISGTAESYRASDREDTSALFASNASSTTGTGTEAKQKIGIAEGSWVINSRSLLTFRYNHFVDKSQDDPAAHRRDLGLQRDRHASLDSHDLRLPAVAKERLHRFAEDDFSAFAKALTANRQARMQVRTGVVMWSLGWYLNDRRKGVDRMPHRAAMGHVRTFRGKMT